MNREEFQPLTVEDVAHLDFLTSQWAVEVAFPRVKEILDGVPTVEQLHALIIEAYSHGVDKGLKATSMMVRNVATRDMTPDERMDWELEAELKAAEGEVQ